MTVPTELLTMAEAHEASYIRKIESLTMENERLRVALDYAEQMRPHWAQGYSSDGIAAQASFGALNSIWKALGVNDQTAAMAKIKQLMKA